MNKKKQISKVQLLFVLVHTQIGVGIITLPYDVFLKAKGDSWISIITAGFIIQIVIILFGNLIKRFPLNNLFEIIQIVFGNILGKLLVILICLFYIYQGGATVASFSAILKSWMMPNTPKSVLVILVLTLAVYASIGNLKQISYFLTTTVGLLLVFISFAIYALKSAKLTYVLPLGISGVKSISLGALTALYSFIGFEFFIILYPYVRANRSEIIKISSLANLIVTFFYTFATISSVMFFSPKELMMLPEPILYLVKSFNFKVIERPDLLFTSLWIIFVITTFIMMLYIISLGLSTLKKGSSRVLFVYLAAIVIFIIGSLSYGEYKVLTLFKYFNPMAIVITIIIPMFVLFSSVVFKKKGEA